MITSGRRPKRPDGAVYRQMRRQALSGRPSLLEIGTRRRHGSAADSLLRATARSLTFLLTTLLRRRGR